MGTIENILSHEIVQMLGWTLVHFVWQAVLLAVLLAIVLRVLRRSSANIRYMIACVALGLIVLSPIATIRSVGVEVPALDIAKLRALDLPTEAFTEVPVVEMPVVNTVVETKNTAVKPPILWRVKAVSIFEPALAYIVLGWLVGVFGLSFWHLGGWRQLQRLRRRMVKQVDASLLGKLEKLAERLGVSQAVQLMESALVQVPTVIGWVKPVILLPASALTGLTSEQIEAILAHELAHIQRGDYLVNLLQTVVEVLGFYHPAVWWVSHKIRVERENCCDDLAVSISGSRFRYAEALTSMAEIRAGQLSLAVAVSGGSLIERIGRLIGKTPEEKKQTGWLPSVIAVVLVMSLLIPVTLAMSSRTKPSIEQDSEKVDYSSVTVEEGVGFDDIIVGDVNCTGEFIKSKFGKPDKEVRSEKTGWWLNYRKKYGIDFWLDKKGALREIRLNKGFKGKLTSGISMSSTMKDVFGIYGEPASKHIVDDLTKHFDNQVLYKRSRLFSREYSKIFYNQKWLLFWFKGNKISQFVIFPKRKKSAVQVEGRLAEKVTTKEQLSFGSVINREISILKSRDDAYMTDFLIDFDTGKLFRFPKKFQHLLGKSEGESEVSEWCKENGVDVAAAAVGFFLPDKGYFGGVGLVQDWAGGIFLHLSNESWDSITPEELKSKLQREKLDKSAGVNEIPETFGFKTLEGNIGLLQILGGNDEKMKIHYKIVAASAKSKPDMQVEGEEKKVAGELELRRLPQSKYRLYDKSGSVRDAVIYTGAPEKRVDGHVRFLSHKSPARLPNKSELLFVRKILNVTSIENYEQLLCPESLQQISQSKGAMITHMNKKASIEKGKWPISAPAGVKVIATINDYTDLNTDAVEFALKPTHSVALMYYHEEINMFLGSTLYLIERDGEIALVSDAYSEWGAHSWQMSEDLQGLYTALKSYAKVNDDRLPDSLNELNGKLETDVLQRLIANVIYIGTGKILNTQSDDAIAYDKHASRKGKKSILKSNGMLSYEVKVKADVERAKLEAEKAMTEAEKARVEAERARYEAEISKMQAEKAKLEAKKAKAEAEKAKLEALRAKDEAEIAKTQAEKAKVEALKMKTRLESAKKLKKLGVAMAVYAHDHQNRYPDTLKQLEPYTALVQWVTENVKYMGNVRTPADSPNMVLAYDKTLLKNGDGTNVLFNDIHVKFVKPKELEKLGIRGEKLKAQILIDCRICEIFDSPLDWETRMQIKNLAGEKISINDSNTLPVSPREVLKDATDKGMSGQKFDAEVDLLVSKGYLKILKHFIIETNDGEAGTIKSRSDSRYISGYTEPNGVGEEPQPKYDYLKELYVKVLAKLQDDRKNILLEVDLNFSPLIKFEKRMYKEKYPYKIPLMSTRSLKTRALLSSGKTLVIRGFIDLDKEVVILIKAEKVEQNNIPTE